MAKKCSACFSPLLHKDVSYNIQKCGFTADQHTMSLWVFLFPLFFPHFSPACCLSQLMFVAQLATAAPRCRGKAPNMTQCIGPNMLTPHIPGSLMAKPWLQRVPEQPGLTRSCCLPLAQDKHPQPHSQALGTPGNQQASLLLVIAPGLV